MLNLLVQLGDGVLLRRSKARQPSTAATSTSSTSASTASNPTPRHAPNHPARQPTCSPPPRALSKPQQLGRRRLLGASEASHQIDRRVGFARREERVRCAVGGARAPCAPNAVGMIIDTLRHVIAHNRLDGGDIEPSRGDISGHEHTCLASLESAEGLLTLRLCGRGERGEAASVEWVVTRKTSQQGARSREQGAGSKEQLIGSNEERVGNPLGSDRRVWPPPFGQAGRGTCG